MRNPSMLLLFFLLIVVVLRDAKAAEYAEVTEEDVSYLNGLSYFYGQCLAAVSLELSDEETVAMCNEIIPAVDEFLDNPAVRPTMKHTFLMQAERLAAYFIRQFEYEVEREERAEKIMDYLLDEV